MEKRQYHKIGEVFGTRTIIAIEIHNKKTKYITKCKCGHLDKYIGFELRQKKKCRYCLCYALLGKKNHKLTFLKYINCWKFEAQCECGKICIVRSRARSCGCHVKERVSNKAKMIEGKKIGAFKIKKYLGPNEEGDSTYLILCKCGNQKIVNVNFINTRKSCGCRINANKAKGSRQGNSRFTEIEVKSLKEMFHSGLYSLDELSKIFNASRAYIRDFLTEKNWKHVQIDPKLTKIKLIKNNMTKINPGDKFRSWTVLNKSLSKHKRSYYTCQCECGNVRDVAAAELRKGNSTKCRYCVQRPKKPINVEEKNESKYKRNNDSIVKIYPRKI